MTLEAHQTPKEEIVEDSLLKAICTSKTTVRYKQVAGFRKLGIETSQKVTLPV